MTKCLFSEESTITGQVVTIDERKRKVKKQILIFATTLCLSGCAFSLGSDCQDTIKSEALSPDGKHIATLYERDCGATADFSTIISLRASSEEFHSQKGRVFVIEGQPQAELVWRDAQNLQVTCKGCRANDIFKQEGRWNEIGISY